MLLNFIATNEEEALWVSFMMEMESRLEPFSLKNEEEAASSWDIASF